MESKRKLKIGHNILYHGNCLEILPTLPAHCADAVICDPPYTVPTNAANGGRRQKNELGAHQADAATKTVGDLSLIEAAFCVWFSEILRVLKNTGRVFVFCDHITYPVIMRAAYGKFAYSRCLTWDKMHFGLGFEFRPQTEFIFYARCGGARLAKINNQSDILRYKPVSAKKRLHPAEKPVALIESLLRYCGKIVLDPFMGSGTVLEACAKTGRMGIGMEIEQRFYDVAVGRLNRVQSELNQEDTAKTIERIERIHNESQRREPL
jgi:site-specific DNA-methyltransferase (adenine-specific)